MKTITICPRHQEYQVPLIPTMVFSGAETWCPYCGETFGNLYGDFDVTETTELKNRAEKYKEKYKDYLRSVAIVSASHIRWNGEMIKPSDLPQEEKDRLQNIRENDWKPETKID